jgi:hypothetical protein
MNRWRVIVVAVIVCSILIIAASEFAFARPWVGVPGRTPWSLRPDVRDWRLMSFGPSGVVRGLTADVGGWLAEFLVGTFLLYLAPRRMRGMARALDTGGVALLRQLAIGLALVVVLAAMAVLAALSIHTLPLPFILVGVFFLAALTGVVAISFELGRAMLARAGWYGQRPLAALALGTLVVFAASRIPFLGVVVLIVVALTGAGVVVATHFGSDQPWSLDPLIEEYQA